MVAGNMHATALEIAVWEALQRVIDPEPGISLLDLGLVQSVAVADGRAIIELALTTPFCPLVDVMEHRDCGWKRILGARASPPAYRDERTASWERGRPRPHAETAGGSASWERGRPRPHKQT